MARWLMVGMVVAAGATGDTGDTTDTGVGAEATGGTGGTGDTGATHVSPYAAQPRGEADLGVGVRQLPRWIKQHGGAGYDEGFTIVAVPEGTFVGGATRSSWYRPFLDPCLDVVNAMPRDCSDAVVFEAQTRVGVQLGGLASDEVRALKVSGGHVTFAGRSRNPSNPQALTQGGYVTRYTADLLTQVYDTRMLRAEFLGMALYLDQPYPVGATLYNWQPPEANAGGDDALAMRLTTAGVVQTTQQLGSPVFDELHDVAIDATGVYMAGITSGYLGPFGGIDPGGEDGLVLAWSPTLLEPEEICRVQLGTSGRDGAEGIAIEGDHLYVVGNVEGAMNHEFPDGSTCYHGGGNEQPDAYVAKYDKACQHVWTRQFGTELAEAAEAVATDAQHVYVVGYAASGTDHVAGPRAPTTDGFLRIYTHDGELVGEVIFDSSPSTDDLRVDYARGVAVDADFVYVTGGTDGDLGQPGDVGLPNAGDRDIFVAKIPKASVIGNATYAGPGCP